ncbi:EEF1A lysine methyltransferase 4-like isoform X3 [Carya illinoinensis]|uniref:EEF1A lysine methyltransferase 4-like isoform X3 n=1 Tax=Carya illinoinensis TaxID=32201 RepID=UPI001C71F7B5|nr:EEF1A lysine methyltransferase 4-like isoform X3 [Carya illinoinensis]
MYRDTSSCNTYNYGDARYWDARYVQEGGSFDWYQRYTALRPFVRKYIPTSSRVLMVGCGNAVMSEDMVKDGYEDIMNIDISSVAIDMMRRKYENIPQLKYMQMDVRNMSFFPDESVDSVIDKVCCHRGICTLLVLELGTLDSLMITYGDPTVRMPHLSRPLYKWKTVLYIIPRPGFERPGSCSLTTKSYLEPVPTTEKGLLPADFVLEDPDSHFIYVCKKMDETELSNMPIFPLTNNVF